MTEWKGVNHFCKKLHLRSLTVVLNTLSGISKIEYILKVKFTFYAKAQGKVSTYARMMKSKYCKKDVASCKSMCEMIWLNRWNKCSEMFRKIANFKFEGGAAGSLERHWKPTPSQILSCRSIEISDNSNPTRCTTGVSYLLSYHVHCLRFQ